MSYLTGIITLIVGLALSIALHELGHLVPAKKFGVLTTQYMLGFGPTLWSKKFGETEFGVKLIWLGGYVRMVGMYAPGHPGRRTHNRKGELTLAEQARQEAQSQIPAGQEHRAFYAQPVWKRLVIMVSGTLVNLALALICLLVALCGIGVQGPTLDLENVASDSPAASAGLQAGDRVVAWNGATVSDWSQVQELIGASVAGKEATITVQRPSTSTQATSTPQKLELRVRPGTKDGRSFLGITPAFARQPYTLGRALSAGWDMAVRTARILVALPVKLWETAVSLFQPGVERDPNSVIGLVGIGQAAGQISSSQAPGYGLADKVGSFLLMFGSLNLTLFMFNLIPLMPLDGGQAAGAIYEAIRDGWRRLRGREPLGPVDLARLLPVTVTMVFAFIAMTVLLIVADILKPI